MSEKPRDVTEAELAVLQLLWDLGEATIRDLADELYPDGDAAHYATVQKLLERLESKGCVDRDRGSVPHVFCATVAREELVGRRLQDLADKLCDGSLTSLMAQLVRGRRWSKADRRALRVLVEELDLPKGGKGSRS